MKGMRSGFLIRGILLFFVVLGLSITAHSPPPSFADDSAWTQKCKSGFSAIGHGIKGLPGMAADGVRTWAKEVKEHPIKRLILAPVRQDPWWVINGKPLLGKAHWLYSPTYALSRGKSTLALLPAAIGGGAFWLWADSKIEEKEFANFLKLAPATPGSEYAFALMQSGLIPPSEITDRLSSHNVALRKWSQAKGKSQGQFDALGPNSLPRLKELVERGTLNPEEARLLDQLAYQAYINASKEADSSPEVRKEFGAAVERHFSKLLLSESRLKSKSEHDFLMMFLLLTPQFEVADQKDVDLYEYLLSAQTGQTPKTSATVQQWFQKNKAKLTPLAPLALDAPPGQLLAVAAQTLEDSEGLKKKAADATFLPTEKRYLALRADLPDYAGEILFREKIGSGTRKLRGELERWRHLMTDDTVAEIKTAWLGGELSDFQALEQHDRLLVGRTQFYEMIAQKSEPIDANLCKLTTNPLFAMSLYHSSEAAKARKLSGSARSVCVRDVLKLTWSYWAAQGNMEDAAQRDRLREKLLVDLQAMLNQCPKDPAAPPFACENRR